MNTRTRRFIAHFSAPFTLKGMDGLQPAGPYALDQEEEMIPVMSAVAYRRVGLFMHLPAVSANRWTLRLVPVEPCDIEAAILQDLDRSDDVAKTRE